MAFGTATEDSELLFLNVMHESSVPDRLVQSVCQNPHPSPDLGHLYAFIKQHLRLLTHFGSEFAAGTPLSRCEKGTYATLAVKLHVALDRHKRHSKSARDLRLSRVAIDPQAGL